MAALKQFQMYIMLFAFTVHMEHIKPPHKMICDGKNLNSELLENDHAWILTQYCSTSEFSDEDWAKEFGC